MIKKMLQKWLEIPVATPKQAAKPGRRPVPEVPRTAMGWPTFGPEFFTLPQLILEARKWRNNWPGTVGGGEWKKYTDELIRRGYSTSVEIEYNLLPDQVQRSEEPDWVWQIKGI